MPKQSIQGMTVLEVMLTITVLAVVLSMGLPAMAHLIEHNRVVAAQQSLLSAIHITRSTAIKTNQRATLCPSRNGKTCTPDTDWHHGWILFPDPHAVGQPDNNIIRVENARAHLSISGNQPVASYISYLGNGRSAQLSGALQMGTVSICTQNQNSAIVINSTGRPRLGSGNC